MLDYKKADTSDLKELNRLAYDSGIQVSIEVKLKV